MLYVVTYKATLLLPGIQPGLVDSESTVITATLQERERMTNSNFFERFVGQRFKFGRISFSGSIEVSIPACHAGDPGSIPGRRVFCFSDR